MPSAGLFPAKFHFALTCSRHLSGATFCATCHAALPEEWVMTPEQVAKVSMIDAHARAEHATAMAQLEPASSADTDAAIP